MAAECARDAAPQVKDLADAADVLGHLLRAGATEAAGAFLDAWCGARAADDRAADAVQLAKQAEQRNLRLSPEVSRMLAEAVLADGNRCPEHDATALSWLSKTEPLSGLQPVVQLRIVEIAVGRLTVTERAREDAETCLIQIPGNNWSDDAMELLVEVLNDQPASRWPQKFLTYAEQVMLQQLWVPLARSLRHTADACLLGVHRGCTEDLTPQGTIFFGHPYKRALRRRLRKAINDACRSLPNLLVRYADEIQPKIPILSCKICHAIRTARLAVFDLTPDCPKVFRVMCRWGKANANVAIELGLAFAYGTQAVLIARAGCPVPVDIGGHEILYFSDYPGLAMGLRDRIAAVL